MPNLFHRLMLPSIAWLALAAAAPAQALLEGEFGDIDLGRTLIEPGRVPTVKELRELAKEPAVRPVMLLKLYGDRDNHYLPVWSSDGSRLAFQRSNVQERASQLLIFDTLGQAAPRLLTTDDGAYDYMFRFGVNSPAAFVFSRIEAGQAGARLMFSPDGQNPTPISPPGERRQLPSLYERTDGIWRLAYDRDGQVLHEAFNAAGEVQAPLAVFKGTSPRWSRDGFRLLLARESFARGKGAAGAVGGFEMLVRNLKTEQDQVLPAAGVVRSPSWSPDEKRAAFYVKDAGDNKPWRVQVCSTEGAAAARTLGADVAVNPNFESEGPCWEPSGRRVWFFSHRHRKQAYYPLVAVDVETAAESVIDYPSRCTTPNDLALNPAAYVPEAAFVAHDGLPQDLYVLFLNHY